MSLNFEIISEKNDCSRIKLSGALDSNTSPELQAAINESIDSSIRTVILDMKHLDFLSSAGLRVIFKLKKDLSGRDGKLLMVYLQPQVRKVFEIITATHNMQVFSSLEELDEYLASMQQQVVDANRNNA